MIAWYRAWKAERARKRRVAAERALAAYFEHLRQHMEALGSINSVMRGAPAPDDHATHVRLNAELRASMPNPLTLIEWPDSRTDAERAADLAEYAVNDLNRPKGAQC